jgi:ent-kaurene synthase
LVRKSFIDFLCCFLDPFTRFSQEHHFSSTLGGYLKDIGAVLELFRASEIIHHDESNLEKQNFLTRHFLRRELSNGSIHTDQLNKYIVQEVPVVKPLSLI